MRYKKEKIAKMNKWDLRELKKKKLKESLKGKGRYLFVNNTKGDLSLLKPPLKGRNPVPPGQTFEGDSYFFTLQRTGDIRLIEVIEAPKPPVPVLEAPKPINQANMEKKLMLDQPERFTNAGHTEQVLPDVNPKKTKLNEINQQTNQVVKPTILLQKTH